MPRYFTWLVWELVHNPDARQAYLKAKRRHRPSRLRGFAQFMPSEGQYKALRSGSRKKINFEIEKEWSAPKSARKRAARTKRVQARTASASPAAASTSSSLPLVPKHPKPNWPSHP